MFVLCCLLPLSGQAAQFLTGELTYETLFGTTPNQYRVRLRLQRDCAGAAFNPTETLSCRVGPPQTACASTDTRNFTATLTRTATTTIGHPYCTINPVPNVNQCDPNAPFNYEETYYEAVVTLPPAAEWTLSWEACCRPALANVQNAAAQPLYLEATLRNQLVVNGATRTVVNTSTQYLNQDAPTFVVCRNQRSTLSFSSFEPDGDSLAYDLVAPLTACNTPVVYQSFAPGGLLPLPNDPAGQPCQAQLPAGATSYSAAFPLPSYVLTGSCPTRTGLPSWQFYSHTSAFTFHSSVYYPEATVADRARNRYVVAGKVTEYRRLNGAYYEVGSMTRNMLVVIIDCEQYQFANHAPQINPAMRVDNGVQTVALTDTVRVAPGQTVSVLLTGTDPDGAHQLSFSTPLLQGPVPVPAGAFQANTATLNQLGLTFSPPATQLPGTYLAAVRAEDNNCPVGGIHRAVIRFKVGQRVLGTARAAAPSLTTASPNPFAEAVTFRVAGATGPTRLVVSNVLGQVVAELLLRPTADGSATTTWRPAEPLPAGVYLARVAGSGQTLRLLRR
ncbi:hypothetical protein DLM85_09320 [Hymenobacter edaphi]|uniref:Secretion system C-terminal sorting domain-containing protein n=1 Tax=Hymenobacter edaphi TaxID=2211146 RepID=A0A328BP33_9BACT|nr:hypothetical protein DLM85_09320 [Hymenobacter edaphi]